MGKYRKFTPAYRDEAVRKVIEGPDSIAAVAGALGINEGTFGKLGCDLPAGPPGQ